MSLKENNLLLVKPFIPNKALSIRNNGKLYAIKITENKSTSILQYTVPSHNQTGLVGERSFNTVVPKFIRRNVNTFETLGLLQAEMGKQQDGKISFANHEPSIINKVIRWFQEELDFPSSRWNWNIKLNINEPIDASYKQKIETKLVEYWRKQTRLSINQAYPKRVCYVKRTHNKQRLENDYGTLTIERRTNLFSQIVKNLVKSITANLCSYSEGEIRGFMRGIIAGEGCIDFANKSKHYRVLISAVNDEERRIYQNGLSQLKINSINYPCTLALVVSKRQNHLELLKQNLLILSPEKHQQFLTMLAQYERPAFRIST